MLKDKVILVTGASRGIGRQTALLCAKNKANVIINYNKSKKDAQSLLSEIKKLGVKATTIKADVSNPDEVKAMFKKIKDEFGNLDVLVNNAGIIHDNLLLMTRESDYDSIMDINVKGCFLCMQHATKMMMRKKSGKIINVSSIVGRYGNSGQVVYAASKAAIIGMTLSSAKELAQFGITVNAVAPGLIDTDMITSLKPEFKKQLMDGIALNKLGKPMDVAKVILFLCSDLSDYVSGQVIGVDGCMKM